LHINAGFTNKISTEIRKSSEAERGFLYMGGHKNQLFHFKTNKKTGFFNTSALW
jgi:hypothetical protein